MDLSKDETTGGQTLTLLLYVAGNSENSMRAKLNLKDICHNYLSDNYQLEIINILEDTQRALKDGVFITPSLVKLYPLPACKIIGDLSQTEKVLMALGIETKTPLRSIL